MDLRRNISFTILLVTRHSDGRMTFLRNVVTKYSDLKCLRDGGSSSPSTKLPSANLGYVVVSDNAENDRQGQ